MGIALRILVDDASHGLAILAIEARRTRRRPDIRHAIFAVETDMAFGTIDTVFPSNAFDGNAIFAVFTRNGNPVFAVNADTGLAISTIDAHMAILARGAVFPGTADVQVVIELEVVDFLSVIPCLLGNLEIAFRIGTFSSRSCFTSNRNFRMVFVNIRDVLFNSMQLAAVDGIGRTLADITLRDIRDLVAAIIQARIRQADILCSVSRVLDGDTAIVDGRIAHRDGAIIPKVQVLVQFDLEVCTIHLGCDIGTITFHLNRAAQICLCTCIIICRKPKGAVIKHLSYIIDVTGHLVAQLVQLVFRGSAAGYIIRRVIICIGQIVHIVTRRYYSAF